MTLVSDREYLITNRGILDRGEAPWLLCLAEFDLAGGWAADGQSSCVEWLMHWVGMPRSTAFEKLQLARALRCRRALARALQEGRITYSAARAPDPDGEVDEAVLQVAEECSIADVERVVLSSLDQDRRPATGSSHRWVFPYADGFTKLDADLTDAEAREVLAGLRLFDGLARHGQSTIADDSGDELDDEALDEEDPRSLRARTAPKMPRPSPQRRTPSRPPTAWVAALLDLTRAAADHKGKAAVAPTAMNIGGSDPIKLRLRPNPYRVCAKPPNRYARC